MPLLGLMSSLLKGGEVDCLQRKCSCCIGCAEMLGECRYWRRRSGWPAVSAPGSPPLDSMPEAFEDSQMVA